MAGFPPWRNLKKRNAKQQLKRKEQFWTYTEGIASYNTPAIKKNWKNSISWRVISSTISPIPERWKSIPGDSRKQQISWECFNQWSLEIANLLQDRSALFSKILKKIIAVFSCNTNFSQSSSTQKLLWACLEVGRKWKK